MNQIRTAYKSLATPGARHWNLIYGVYVLVVANAGMALFWRDNTEFGYSVYRAVGLIITAVVFFAAPRLILKSWVRFWVAGLFVAWSLTTILWAPALSKALLQGVQLVSLFVVAMGMIVHLGHRRSAQVIAGALTVASAISLLLMAFIPSLGFVDVLHTSTGSELHGSGVYGWNSELGIAAGIGFVFTLSGAILRFQIRTVAYAIINLIALVLSDSATSFAAVAAGVGLFLLLYSKIARLVVLAGAVIGVIVATIVGWSNSIGFALSLVGRDGNLTGRDAIWSATIGEISKRPVQGFGIGASPDYPTLIGRDVSHAHNGFLQLTYERGMIGLLLLAAMLVISVFFLMKIRTDLRLWVLPIMACLLVANYANNFITGVTLAAFVLIWCVAASVPGVPTPDALDVESSEAELESEATRPDTTSENDL